LETNSEDKIPKLEEEKEEEKPIVSFLGTKTTTTRHKA